jgi:hypothetical protein
MGTTRTIFTVENIRRLRAMKEAGADRHVMAGRASWAFSASRSLTTAQLPLMTTNSRRCLHSPQKKTPRRKPRHSYYSITDQSNQQSTRARERSSAM